MNNINRWMKACFEHDGSLKCKAKRCDNHTFNIAADFRFKKWEGYRYLGVIHCFCPEHGKMIDDEIKELTGGRI